MTADVIAAEAEQRQAIRPGPWHPGNPVYCLTSSRPGIARFRDGHARCFIGGRL